MKTFCQFVDPDTHITYEVPLAVIATHRANFYHQKFRESEFPTMESAMADTVGLFEDNLSEARDWAVNQMNWSDLSAYARVIRHSTTTDVNTDGEWSFHDRRATVGELDGATIMKTPVEVVVAIMAESGQLANITIMQTDQGEPHGAVAVLRGNGEMISHFVAAISMTADAIAGRPQNPNQIN